MSIKFDRGNATFYLESKALTYAFQIHKSGFLEHLYFGKRIPREDISHVAHRVIRGHATNNPLTGRDESLDELAQECPQYGRSDFRESMLDFDLKGVRAGDLRYESHKIVKDKPAIEGMPSLRVGGQTLIVTMKDTLRKLRVQLYYSVYEDVSAITRRAVVINDGDSPVQIDRAYSFSMDLPDSKYQTISLTGAHLRERYMTRTDLVQGTFSVDSKYGVSSAQRNPFLALVRKNTTEDCGDAYGFQVVYSGNFVLKVESNQGGSARVTGGINDFDFAWTLGAGESFSTPEAVLVYSKEGLGGMSRSFHDLYRKYLMPTTFAYKPRPIVLNNWEATYFDFDEAKLCSLIERARGTGIDTFVLDDGWFGERNGESAGLGDWYINFNKLTNGFKPIIDCAHRNGMKFGLWFEPEMVNDDSDLYRAHPDWIIHIDGLEPCRGRLQFVLDLTRKEVRDYIVDSLSLILSENQIDYVKWDMNRSITENYSASLGERGKEFSHRYVLGLYDILERLTKRFSNVLFEGCASGGCRFDPGVLAYFPQIWTSDNSDAYSRSIIQYGTSLCYPLSAMSCHVSVCPNHQTGRVTPFHARTAIAHLGATGYELDPTKLSEEDFEQIAKDTQLYRDEIQDLVLCGDLYRISNPLEENFFAETLVSKDKTRAVITVMRPLFTANDYPTRIYPTGLDEKKFYSIKEMKGKVLKGATIMNAGLVLYMPWGDFQTTVLHLEQVD